MTYAVGLNLAGRRVLVVGGGPVAERRTAPLVAEGAHVHVVAPEVTDVLRERARAGELTWHERGYRTEDLDECWLVLAHTGSPQLQDRVAAEAEERRIPCVKGGDPAAGTAWVPATAEAHGVQVSVHASRDPRRAAAVAAWVAARLESGEVPVGARREDAPEPGAQPPGTVALVGGGPGDPGLLTVRGRHLLAGADVVVADRLGPTDLLPGLAEHARIVDVGKRAGYHTLTQDRINETLVEQARLGLRVVRLKGGDPYVFGRGGEEVEFCHAHGVPTEVVPGVTSAISVPAAAGIPVTHRDIAHGFTVITAHQELHHVPYREGHTLILMMGVRGLARNAETLVAAGYPEDIPVAVVERGWTPEQRSTVGELGSIAALAEERDVRAPAVILVGRVAALGRG
ncbi:uroporphyrinogen-III C-methyltransferase [Kocuria sp.]|uniref:uroporphyrinogen-III C-methyltransferase n=1 Tax=Kocuria sp. TaxID=1871328 RepID=UPI0026DDC7F9|nr:uroporphyrinogen-III C-methyltransferase [Kocuria sp.]MDO4918440.1 uroporphyrinogen-III C-methyltransferase [Kocuria sp.]